MIFYFTKNPNLKKWGGKVGGEGGSKVSDFLTRNPNLKKKCAVGVGG